MHSPSFVAAASWRLRGWGVSIQDGWGYVGLERKPGDRGAVFFHQGDVFDALEGTGDLLLAFGAFEDEPAKADAAHRRIAEEAIAVLNECSIDTRWSTSTRERISIPRFEWRKRRWTDSPLTTRSGPRGQHTEGVPRAVGGGQRSFAEASYEQKVVALRSSKGFTRWLENAMRKAWLMVGGERGQIGHSGPPHVFVRAGEVTSFVPRDAFENVQEEVLAIRKRAELIAASRR